MSMMEFHLNQIAWLPKTSVNVMWTEILSRLKSSGKSQCKEMVYFYCSIWLLKRPS